MVFLRLAHLVMVAGDLVYSVQHFAVIAQAII
jgi:hypothetical protein